MIIGCGIDIVKVSRFKDAKDSFLKRVFSALEIENAKEIKEKENYFAKRFAAKEALYKAYNNKIDFKDISVLNDSNGRPYFDISFDNMKIHLSLSDEKEYVIASVIVESL